MGNMLDRERYKVAIPQLENRIKTLEGSVEGLIVKHYAQDVTVPASNVKSIYFTGIDIKGYEPIAIAEMQTSGQYTSYLTFYRWDFNNDKDTVNIYVRNSRGDDASLSIEIAVVYLTTQARIKSVVSTGGSGGGGGTSNYNDLENKPQINSVTLVGNKSGSSLGLADSVHTHVMADVTDLETVTQLRDGIMTALDKQKLDGIASGAEVNVQSDWNQATNTADDYIKNKPTIPSKTSDLNNDSGFISTETDPVFTASDAYGITSADISNWDDKSEVSLTRYTTSGTNIADITIDGTTTKLYAPTSGGGGVTDYDQLTSRPQINSNTLTGDKSSADLGLADAVHTHSQYLTSETDPVFTASDAYGISSSDISNWNSKANGSHTHSGSDITSLSYGSDDLFYVSDSPSVSLASLAAGSTKSGNVSDTKAGYKALGIVGYHVSGTTVSGVNVYNMYLSSAPTGSYTLQYGIRNVMSSTSLSANCSISFNVLWVKV